MPSLCICLFAKSIFVRIVIVLQCAMLYLDRFVNLIVTRTCRGNYLPIYGLSYQLIFHRFYSFAALQVEFSLEEKKKEKEKSAMMYFYCTITQRSIRLMSVIDPLSLRAHVHIYTRMHDYADKTIGFTLFYFVS